MFDLNTLKCVETDLPLAHGLFPECSAPLGRTRIRLARGGGDAGGSSQCGCKIGIRGAGAHQGGGGRRWNAPWMPFLTTFFINAAETVKYTQ